MENEILQQINSTINIWNDELKIVKKQLRKIENRIKAIQIQQETAKAERYIFKQQIKKLS